MTIGARPSPPRRAKERAKSKGPIDAEFLLPSPPRDLDAQPRAYVAGGRLHLAGLPHRISAGHSAHAASPPATTRVGDGQRHSGDSQPGAFRIPAARALAGRT